MDDFKAGDRIIFGRGKANRDLAPDITIGKIYTLFVAEGGLAFIDNVGDTNYAGMSMYCCPSTRKATKIIN